MRPKRAAGAAAAADARSARVTCRIEPVEDSIANPASSRPGQGPRATDDGVLSRLALWLAEVAAEAALTPLRQPEPAADQADPGSSRE